MRNIEELHQKHAGQDIWVVGSGASMNHVDRSFFDNKIAIGVNEVWNKFDTLTYYIRKEDIARDETLNAIKGAPLIISRGIWGGAYATDPNVADVTKEILPDNVYYFDHRPNKCSGFSRVEIPEESNMLAVSWSTIVSGIHFAYRLGAKSIILCGHDCGSIDGKKNINDYFKFSTITEAEGGVIPYINFESQTKVIVEYLREKGIAVHSLNPFVNLGLEGHIYER